MSRHQTRLRKTVVIDFGRGAVRIAEAESAAEAVRFRETTSIDVPGYGPGASASDNAETVRLVRAEVTRKGWSGRQAACLLSGSATSTQSFLFPSIPSADLRAAIEIKLDETLHFDVDDASFDYRTVRDIEVDGNRQALVLVAAARTDAVRHAILLMRQFGLIPVAVGAAAESLANLAYYARLTLEEEATVHVTVGSGSTILNLLDGRMLRFSREVDVAGHDFEQALTRPIITREGPVQLGLDEAKEVFAAVGFPREEDDTELSHAIRARDLLPLLEPVVQRLTAEVKRSADYLSSLLGRPVDRILLSGRPKMVNNLASALEEHLGISVTSGDPIARAMSHWRLAISGSEGSSPSEFSPILGYAIGAQHPINLLPREERVEQTLERARRVRNAVAPIAVAGALTFAVAAVPSDRRYREVRDLQDATSDHLRTQLRHQQAIDSQIRETEQRVGELARVRGAVPNWTWVMKELSNVLPSHVRITEFDVDWAGPLPELRFEATMDSSQDEGAMSPADLAAALGESPLFLNVHVIHASLGVNGGSGRFDASMQLVSRSNAPWELR